MRCTDIFHEILLLWWCCCMSVPQLPPRRSHLWLTKGYNPGVCQSLSAFQRRHLYCNVTCFNKYCRPLAFCGLMSNCCLLCEFKEDWQWEVGLVEHSSLSVTVVVLLWLIREKKNPTVVNVTFSLRRSCSFFHSTAILFKVIESVCKVNCFVNKGNVYIVKNQRLFLAVGAQARPFFHWCRCWHKQIKIKTKLDEQMLFPWKLDALPKGKTKKAMWCRFQRRLKRLCWSRVPALPLASGRRVQWRP